MRIISIGDTVISVEVADTANLREQGLSGRENICGTRLRQGCGEARGMLFVFDTDGLWNIWMKDMRFPIDIVWADVSGMVITIASNVAPDTYPKSFYPSAPARYVIELPAGFAAAHGIVEGSQIVL